MSNSIIDQQRDNADFKIVRSPYNGGYFIRSFSGENPKDFYKNPDGFISDATRFLHPYLLPSGVTREPNENNL